jgi:hypothetical protein
LVWEIAGARQKALLFVNKKQQKNFFNTGLWRTETPGSRLNKIFAPLFLKSGCFPDGDALARR